jgi:endonuclease/exonuclease/phosphatase family metal-dependent hydrolase
LKYNLYRPLNLSVLLFVLLLPAGSVSAQTIPVLGTPETFDVATWNVLWFGNPSNGPSDDDAQVRHVKDVILETKVDFWALQEVASTSRFQQLLDALGSDWAGDLASNSGTQRIAFVYNTTVVSKRNIKHILESFTSQYFAGRPPLEIEINVTLPNRTVVLSIITVHMKAFGDATSYQKRVGGSARLKNHIDFTSLVDKPVMIIGDFNDELTSSTYAGQTSPYANFVSDTAGYFFPSMSLERANLPTWCANGVCNSGSTIDHILITNELMENYVDDSVTRIKELITAIPNYRANTSDHLPVVARFSFETATDAETQSTLPKTSNIISLWPNPSSRRVDLELSLATSGRIVVQVYDILGRLVSETEETLSAGSRSTSISTANFAPGLYSIRLISPSGISTRTFVKAQ